MIMKRLLECYLRGGSLFTLYVHPFELFSRSNPDLPAGTTNSDKLRFALGRSSSVSGDLPALPGRYPECDSSGSDMRNSPS